MKHSTENTAELQRTALDDLTAPFVNKILMKADKDRWELEM